MKNSLVLVFSLALMSYLIVDVISFTTYGVYISLIILLALCILALRSIEKAYLIFWLLCVLMPEFPRSILDLYSSVGTGDVKYNVISSVKIGPLTLTNIFLFFITGLSLYRYKSVSLAGYRIFLAVFLALIFGMLATSLDSGERPELSAGHMLTSFKFHLFSLCFCIVSALMLSGEKSEYVVARMTQMIALLPPVIGLRAIIFIASDYAFKNPSLDLMTQPIISICAIYFYSLSNNESFRFYKNPIVFSLVLISLLSTSRSVIAITVVSILFLPIIMLLREDGRASFSRYSRLVAYFIVSTFSLLSVIAITNERLYDFIAWKASEFTFSHDSGPSGSALVRKHEIINVSKELGDTPHGLFLGKGYGASFTFFHSPLPISEDLDAKSFTMKEIEEGVFYNPHTFVATLMLRYGLFGVLFYVCFSLFSAALFFRKSIPLSVLSVLLIYNYYFRFEFHMLMVLLTMMSASMKTDVFKRLDTARVSL